MIRDQVFAFPGRPRVLPFLPVDREHEWSKCLIMAASISMCITVDILQHSMPLAFLPSVLEDHGHTPWEIATALGVYYWTGFLGCAIITSFQVWRMFYQKDANDTEDTDYATVQRYIKYLIIALGIGALTLCCQAMHPTLVVHTSCRFVQGFAGAFIFFYTAMLNVALFMDTQQEVAVTMAACALNVAEVVGSFLGAVFFDLWGQSSVFWFLAIVSVVNQVLLLFTMWMIEPSSAPSRANSLRSLTRQGSGLYPTPRTGILTEAAARYLGDADSGGGPDQADEIIYGCVPKPRKGSIAKLKGIFSHTRLVSAVMLIAMGAVIKGAIEEMLPFHADHRWDYEPMKIGELFLICAIGFIVSAVGVCYFWEKLGRYQVHFSAFWLFMLGIVAWCVFSVVAYWKERNILGIRSGDNNLTLDIALFSYGVCLGLTHTPANLLAATVIDREIGAAKDAANGIFQTMWEAGGSAGFFLGGAFAVRYHEQMGLLTGCGIGCAITAIAMLAIVTKWPEDREEADGDIMDGQLNEKDLKQGEL